MNQCKHENEDSEDGPKRSDADSAQEGQPGIEGDGSDTSRNGDAASESEGSPEKKPTGPRELRSKGQSRLLDPITWYGILVPPSLRSAQKFFTDAVESQVPELASVVVEMQVVEQEVYRVRQELAGE